MKKAILLLAWGAGSIPARESLARFDAEVRLRFPGWTVRWAYTSPILRERIGKQRRKSDSAFKALMRLHYEGFNAVALQPLQVIPGREYGEVGQEMARAAAAGGFRCSLGDPLLGSHISLDIVARALAAHIPPVRNANEDVVFMGHGGRHAAGIWYERLARAVSGLDVRIHIGTMGGSRGLDSILPRLESENVWLMPLLATIGRHALEDMAGAGETSWRGMIEGSGRHCVPVLRGLLESGDLVRIWLANLERAMLAL